VKIENTEEKMKKIKVVVKSILSQEVFSKRLISVVVRIE